MFYILAGGAGAGHDDSYSAVDQPMTPPGTNEIRIEPPNPLHIAAGCSVKTSRPLGLPAYRRRRHDAINITGGWANRMRVLTFDWISTDVGVSWRHNNPSRGNERDFKARRIDKWQEK
ncbi:hypothetical protein KCP76_12425 [Salmonella enterica subsp. enterica serovar Weltevreden]|nr:hypothetical protein KCP76_12425 [Salmonella enterica subsp. enterica serovar Weltevreden]